MTVIKYSQWHSAGDEPKKKLFHINNRYRFFWFENKWVNRLCQIAYKSRTSGAFFIMLVLGSLKSAESITITITRKYYWKYLNSFIQNLSFMISAIYFKYLFLKIQ